MNKLEIELRYIKLAGIFFITLGLFLPLVALLSNLIGLEISEFDQLLLRGSWIYFGLGVKILLFSILLKLFKIKSISLNKINTSKGKNNSIWNNFINLIDSHFLSFKKGEKR